MINVLICEDDVIQSKRLENYIRNYFEEKSISYELKIFINAEDVIEDYQNDILYDIVFLDIILPNKSGVELAHLIRKYDKCCVIIFLTTSREFAIESYEVKALNYLLKPFDVEKMNEIMDDACKIVETKDEKFTSIANKSGTFILKNKDIVYCESYKRKIFIHIKGYDEFVTTFRLDTVEELLNDQRFLRCHKSYLVNMDYIVKIENRNFILVDGSEIPIPRENLHNMKAKYFDYIYSKAK